jgi:hypothetical protein
MTERERSNAMRSTPTFRIAFDGWPANLYGTRRNNRDSRQVN